MEKKKLKERSQEKYPTKVNLQTSKLKGSKCSSPSCASARLSKVTANSYQL